MFPKEGFRYDARQNAVVVPEEVINKGYESVGSVLNVTGKSPYHFDFDGIPEPYLVFSDDDEFIAVTDKPFVDSVMFRLLGLFPVDDRHFKNVFFDYTIGGIWSVH